MNITKSRPINTICIIILTLISLTAKANECNYKYPSFLVDGVEQWDKLSAKEIYAKAGDKITLTKAYRGEKEGISLGILIKPHAKQGTLVVHACKRNKSVTYDVKDLFSDTSKAPTYVLILSRNNFFKMITTDNSQPVLKKINSFKLITHKYK